MPVTVKVNGTANSLVHKGSNGISTATIPDVCKTPTPGGPVPMPYPNISQAAMLDKGTSTVKADGGMMIAVKGSEFSMSNGDQPGTIGGVKSNVFMKESTWILYSFDVKMDGKNACRLTDKMFHNHENTANLAGVLQSPVPGDIYKDLVKIAKCCQRAVDCSASKGEGCTQRGTAKHSCCKKAIDKANSPHVSAEMHHGGDPICRLDVQKPKDATAKKVTHIWDFKFNCTKDPQMSQTQRIKYNKKFKRKGGMKPKIEVVKAGRGAENKKVPLKGCKKSESNPDNC